MMLYSTMIPGKMYKYLARTPLGIYRAAERESGTLVGYLVQNDLITVLGLDVAADPTRSFLHYPAMHVLVAARLVEGWVGASWIDMSDWELVKHSHHR